MFLSVLLLVHLLGFAAYVGGAFGQRLLMRSSAQAGVAPAVRDAYERAAATVATKVELVGLFVQVISGVLILVLAPDFLKQHWMHAKLTAVLILLVVAHLEMINARRIAKARAARGDAAEAEIQGRKGRQAALGVVSGLFIGAIVLLVTVLRNAF